jgi:hypothetical protein
MEEFYKHFCTKNDCDNEKINLYYSLIQKIKEKNKILNKFKEENILVYELIKSLIKDIEIFYETKNRQTHGKFKDNSKRFYFDWLIYILMFNPKYSQEFNFDERYKQKFENFLLTKKYIFESSTRVIRYKKDPLIILRKRENFFFVAKRTKLDDALISIILNYMRLIPMENFSKCYYITFSQKSGNIWIFIEAFYKKSSYFNNISIYDNNVRHVDFIEYFNDLIKTFMTKIKTLGEHVIKKMIDHKKYYEFLLLRNGDQDYFFTILLTTINIKNIIIKNENDYILKNARRNVEWFDIQGLKNVKRGYSKSYNRDSDIIRIIQNVRDNFNNQKITEIENYFKNQVNKLKVDFYKEIKQIMIQLIFIMFCVKKWFLISKLDYHFSNILLEKIDTKITGIIFKIGDKKMRIDKKMSKIGLFLIKTFDHDSFYLTKDSINFLTNNNNEIKIFLNKMKNIKDRVLSIPYELNYFLDYIVKELPKTYFKDVFTEIYELQKEISKLTIQHEFEYLDEYIQNDFFKHEFFKEFVYEKDPKPNDKVFTYKSRNEITFPLDMFIKRENLFFE